MNTKNNCIRTEKTDTVLRPYEKCLTLGAETLSDAELLAVILRTGVSGMNSIEHSTFFLCAAGQRAYWGFHPSRFLNC